jgi:hypothetical protein
MMLEGETGPASLRSVSAQGPPPTDRRLAAATATADLPLRTFSIDRVRAWVTSTNHHPHPIMDQPIEVTSFIN